MNFATIMWQLFIVTFFDWWEIQFDQVWSSLERSDPKKSKHKMATFILFKNVTTFYTMCNHLILKEVFFAERQTKMETCTDIEALLVV